MQRGERPPTSPPVAILGHIMGLTIQNLPCNVGTVKDAAG